MKSSFHYGKTSERGYVLIATVGILMGLMAIVLSLARISSQAKNDFDQELLTAQARFALETANTYPQAILSRQNPWEMSRLQRNWVLPGTWSLPYKLQLNAAVTTSATSITVSDLTPLFMALATCRDGARKKVSLGTAISISGTTATLDTLYAYSNIARVNPSYYIIENELVLGTSTPTAITITTRGLAGVKSAHPAGSPVYFYDSTLTGYIKMNNEWMFVSGGAATPNFFGKTITVTRGYRNTTPSSAAIGQYVYFFPFDPLLDVGGNIGQIQIDLSNEQSRINLNGLTSSAILSLFSNASLYTAINTNFPLRNLYTAAYLAPSTQSTLNSNDNSLTVFSEPDPNNVEAMKGASEAVFGNAGDPRQRTSAGAYVKIHAVNVNEANEDVLKKVFTMMNITTSPTTLAAAISSYRSGGDASPYSINYFNGANPFDGKNTVAGTFYPSPAEEFRAFLATSSASADIQRIMKHVLGEAHDLQTNPVGPMLCFEAGDVWRIQSAVSLGDKKAPKIFRKSELVVKSNPESYSDAGVIASGCIILNAANGWNENYSTFFGVTARQPTIASFNNTHPSGGLSMTFDETGMVNRYSNVCRAMRAIIDNEPAYVVTKFSPSATDRTYKLSSTNPITDFSTARADFGIRVLTSATPATLTLNANFPVFAGNTTLWVTAVGSANWLNQYILHSANDATNYFFAQISQVANGNLTLSNIQFGGSCNTLTLPVGLNIVGSYDANYYLNTVATPGANVTQFAGLAGPFYETVLYKEGATFNSITWTDSSDFANPPDIVLTTRPYVRCVYIINGVETNLARGDINPPTGLLSPLRLRFYFNNTSDPFSLVAPQLFSVKVGYTTNPLAPKTIVYDRK